MPEFAKSNHSLDIRTSTCYTTASRVKSYVEIIPTSCICFLLRITFEHYQSDIKVTGECYGDIYDYNRFNYFKSQLVIQIVSFRSMTTRIL